MTSLTLLSAILQGLSGKEAKEEADLMIADLQLLDKRDVPSSNLSGGMKRKLRQDLIFFNFHIKIWSLLT